MHSWGPQMGEEEMVLMADGHRRHQGQNKSQPPHGGLINWNVSMSLDESKYASLVDLAVVLWFSFSYLYNWSFKQAVLGEWESKKDRKQRVRERGKKLETQMIKQKYRKRGRKSVVEGEVYQKKKKKYKKVSSSIEERGRGAKVKWEMWKIVKVILSEHERGSWCVRPM